MRKKIAATALALLLSGAGLAPASAVELPTMTPVGHCYDANPSYKGKFAYTFSKANIRNQANLKGKIKRSIPADVCIKYTKTSTDSRGVMWVYGTYKGTSGWVSTLNLDWY